MNWRDRLSDWWVVSANYMPSEQGLRILALVRDFPSKWSLETTEGYILISALPQGFVSVGGDNWKFADSALEIHVSSCGDVYIYPDGHKANQCDSRPTSGRIEKEISRLLSEMKTERRNRNTDRHIEKLELLASG